MSFKLQYGEGKNNQKKYDSLSLSLFFFKLLSLPSFTVHTERNPNKETERSFLHLKVNDT